MTEPRFFITIEECHLIPSGDDFDLEVFAKLERSKRAVEGETLTVYVNRRSWGDFPTDRLGRIHSVHEKLRANGCLPGKQVLVEVFHRDTAGNVSKAPKALSTDKPSTAVDPTKTPKSGPPIATTLEATASSGQIVGDKMRYHVTLVARDQFKKTIAAGRVLWNCGPESGEADLSTGYATHTVELAEPEVEFAYTAHSPTANITLAQPLKLAGPKKKEEDKTPVTLEVIPPYCADANGSFMVTVRSKKGEKFVGNIEFTMSSTEALTTTALDRTALGHGHSFTLKTGANGVLTFLLSFGDPRKIQMQVTFSLSSGFSVQQPFVRI